MKNNKNVFIGQLVESVKGYDSGNFYIIKDIKDNIVYLINGFNKTYSNPKKKNLKHIQGFEKGYQFNLSYNEKRINQEIYNIIKNNKKKVNI